MRNRADTGFSNGAMVAALAATIILAVLFAVGLYKVIPRPADDPPCYGLYDRNGRFFPSYDLPYEAGSLSIWVYKTDAEWGLVFGPSATFVDRDCLRGRGVPVEPVGQ